MLVVKGLLAKKVESIGLRENTAAGSVNTRS
jgi:hypothetical protein